MQINKIKVMALMNIQIKVLTIVQIPIKITKFELKYPTGGGRPTLPLLPQDGAGPGVPADLRAGPVPGAGPAGGAEQHQERLLPVRHRHEQLDTDHRRHGGTGRAQVGLGSVTSRHGSRSVLKSSKSNCPLTSCLSNCPNVTQVTLLDLS